MEYSNDISMTSSEVITYGSIIALNLPLKSNCFIVAEGFITKKLYL